MSRHTFPRNHRHTQFEPDQVDNQSTLSTALIPLLPCTCPTRMLCTFLQTSPRIPPDTAPPGTLRTSSTARIPLLPCTCPSRMLYSFLRSSGSITPDTAPPGTLRTSSTARIPLLPCTCPSRMLHSFLRSSPRIPPDTALSGTLRTHSTRALPRPAPGRTAAPAPRACTPGRAALRTAPRGWWPLVPGPSSPRPGPYIAGGHVPCATLAEKNARPTGTAGRHGLCCGPGHGPAIG